MRTAPCKMVRLERMLDCGGVVSQMFHCISTIGGYTVFILYICSIVYVCTFLACSGESLG